MVDLPSLAGNLKRALRGADARFRKATQPIPTHEVTIHKDGLTSVHPFTTQRTSRTARATSLLSERHDLIYLVDEVRIGVMRADGGYVAMQANTFVDELDEYYSGEIEATVSDLLEIHEAILQLFR